MPDQQPPPQMTTASKGKVESEMSDQSNAPNATDWESEWSTEFSFAPMIVAC